MFENPSSLINSVGQLPNSILNLLTNLTNVNNPVAQAAKMAGAMAGSNTWGNAMNTYSQVSQLNPYQEGANKALKKLGEQHVMEASMAGVPPDQIASHSALQPPPLAGAMNQTGAMQPTPDMTRGQQPPQQPQTQTAQQGQQGGFGVHPLQILTALLGGTRGGYDAQTGNMQVPGLLGGLITSSPQMLEAMNQYRAGNPKLQLGMKIAEAQAVPPTQMEQAQLRAGGYQANIDVINKNLERIAQEETATTNAFNAIANSRSGWAKNFTPNALINQYKTKMNALKSQREEAMSNMVELFGKHPNFQTNDNQIGNSFSQEDALAELKRRGEI